MDGDGDQADPLNHHHPTEDSSDGLDPLNYHYSLEQSSNGYGIDPSTTTVPLRLTTLQHHYSDGDGC